MSRVPPFGSAHAEVLIRITSAQGANGCWSRSENTSLYLNRAFTEQLCQGLARQGYLDVRFDGTCHVFSVNEAGYRKADELRSGL